MVEAAWAASRTATRPGARFRRLARRSGRGNEKKAAIAVAHTLISIAWAVMRYDGDYHEAGADYPDRRDARNRDHLIRHHRQTLARLGYQAAPAAGEYTGHYDGRRPRRLLQQNPPARRVVPPKRAVSAFCAGTISAARSTNTPGSREVTPFPAAAGGRRKELRVKNAAGCYRQRPRKGRLPSAGSGSDGHHERTSHDHRRHRARRVRAAVSSADTKPPGNAQFRPGENKRCPLAFGSQPCHGEPGLE
jgi:hypothetical protein